MIDQIARLAGLVGMVLPPRNGAGGVGPRGPMGPKGKPGDLGPQGLQGPPGVTIPSFGLGDVTVTDFVFLGTQDQVLSGAGTRARFWNPRGLPQLQSYGVRVSMRADTMELAPGSALRAFVYSWDDAASILGPPTSTATVDIAPVLVGPRLAVAETYELNYVGGGNIELGANRRVAVQIGPIAPPLSVDDVDYVVEFLFAPVPVPGPTRPILPLP